MEGGDGGGGGRKCTRKEKRREKEVEEKSIHDLPERLVIPVLIDLATSAVASFIINTSLSVHVFDCCLRCFSLFLGVNLRVKSLQTLLLLFLHSGTILCTCLFLCFCVLLEC